jgi:hypothetical protein
VDLFQVLGFVGATGSFELCGDPVNEQGQKIIYDTEKQKKIDNIKLSGVMNASELYNTANESETYTFCYLPGRNELCMPKDIQITVIITRSVKDNSEFK